MITTVIISDVVDDALLASLDTPHLEMVLRDIMAGARAYWIQLAGKRLTSTRRDYINGIQEIEIDGLTASIELVGVLPNMVELGADAYDMHTTLLGPNVPLASPGKAGKRKAADGHFYRAIPFRHQTPGTAGQGGGVPMGRAYEGHSLVENAGKLGRAVYKQAKKLAPTSGQPGGKVSYGGRLAAGIAPKLKAAHSTDIYAGMVRQEKAYKSATQSTFTTFRMISEAVPDKWNHPGIEAANLTGDVEKFVDRIAPQAFAALFGQ
jgi:hypothetical protein